MRVLLVEDSPRLRRTVGEGLKREGFAVDTAEDGQVALDFVLAYDYDVVVLDLMMPKVDGLTVLQRIRSEGKDTHVLILSAKDQVDDRIKGLQLGADDYLTKPFSFAELLARMQALIRRRYQHKSPWLEIGPVQINTALRTVSIHKQELTLTKTEFAILEILTLNRGRVLSREILFEHLYDGYVDVASNVVDVHVCSLRRKLKAHRAGSFVRTKRGYGYYVET